MEIVFVTKFAQILYNIITTLSILSNIYLLIFLNISLFTCFFCFTFKFLLIIIFNQFCKGLFAMVLLHDSLFIVLVIFLYFIFLNARVKVLLDDFFLEMKKSNSNLLWLYKLVDWLYINCNLFF